MTGAAKPFLCVYNVMYPPRRPPSFMKFPFGSCLLADIACRASPQLSFKSTSKSCNSKMAARHLLLLISLFAVLSPVVTGFFPTQWKEDYFGNGGMSHEAMTESAFDDRAYLYFPGITTITSRMRAARAEMIRANIEVDDDQKTAHKHCDGESFGPAKARIQQLKNEAIAALIATPPEVTKARRNVGEALHTIQDFYAHSNWVELGNTEPNTDLIRNGAIESYTATPDQRTCRTCQKLPRPPTWDSDWPIPCVGIDCQANTNDFSKLTSGYYHGEDVAIPGDFKCRHGGISDDGSWAGINKDSLNCWWSPHAHLHVTAADLAERATMQFLDDIKADTSGKPSAIRLLFGVSTLAFAIDTTGSMDDVIDAVRAQAISIAKSLSGTDDEPGLYVISPFNDPTTGPVTVTSDLATFEATINGLGARGGGDCPELAMTGMINAVDVMDYDSGLMLFTDAEAADFGRLPFLLAKAQEKRIAISVFKYASDCEDSGMKMLMGRAITKRAESIYSQLCASTGGLLRTGPRAEAANVTSFIENSLKADVGTILRVEDSLSNTGTNGTRTFYVPVDSYMKNVMFSLLGSGIRLSITTPNGQPISSSTPGLTQTGLEDSTYMSFTLPPSGVYKATISGNGTFTFLSTGVSTLQLSSFNFASIRGRPGHTGWYPMKGNPPFDKDVGAIAEMVGGFKTANFSFRAPSFTIIEGATTSNMTAGSGEPGFPKNSSFFGPAVRVPRQSMLFYVMGEDDNGMSYQRALQAVVLARNETVTVPVNNTSVLYPNSTTPCTSVMSTPVLPGSLYPANSTFRVGRPPVITSAGRAPRVTSTRAPSAKNSAGTGELGTPSFSKGLGTVVGMFLLVFLL